MVLGKVSAVERRDATRATWRATVKQSGFLGWKSRTRCPCPWQVQKWTDFFFQGVMALPYHIYVVSSKIPQNEYTERVQYGTAFVFLPIVAAIAMESIMLRNNLRRRYKW